MTSNNIYLTKVFHFCAAHKYGNSEWSDEKNIEVFTTRPDTLFGASFIALASEHPISKKYAKTNRKRKRKYYKR